MMNKANPMNQLKLFLFLNIQVLLLLQIFCQLSFQMIIKIVQLIVNKKIQQKKKAI